uniref:F-box/WD repeat-containing protein 5-like isoform X3 n=1 Tax=Myxine glutinosa TaxID=7769 RepID=UPI00358FAEAC
MPAVARPGAAGALLSARGARPADGGSGVPTVVPSIERRLPLERPFLPALRHSSICDTTPGSGAESWQAEFRRLHEAVPCVEVVQLHVHVDEVLHVTFSGDGRHFASCAKDCTIKIWALGTAVTLRHSVCLRPHGWQYVRYCQFNEDDSLLMVSGPLCTPHDAGEIIVLSMADFTLLSRIRNKPAASLGAWLGQRHLLSVSHHPLGGFTSISELWVNSAFQDLEPQTDVVRKLFRFLNINGSVVRSLLVADTTGRGGHRDQGAVLGEAPSRNDANEAEAKASALCKTFGDIVCSSPEHGAEEQPQSNKGFCSCDAQPTSTLGMAGNVSKCATEHGQETDGNGEQVIGEACCTLGTRAETQAALHLLGNKLVSPLRPETDTDVPCKWLIFTRGKRTHTAHQIGLKRVWPAQTTCEGPAWEAEGLLDPVDYVIDLDANVVGMGLSPDHRVLYMTCRSWPPGTLISDPMNPPPVAREVELRAFALDTEIFEEAPVCVVPRAQLAFSPGDETSFFQLAVTHDLVASGSEERFATLWDRHYGVAVAHLHHGDRVHAVATCTSRPHLLLSASADNTLRLWSSRSAMRQGTAPRVLSEQLL